ncbi:MAG: class I SAM-dependent methyltransferase, partial [Alphaproteobacteria bacterium]
MNIQASTLLLANRPSGKVHHCRLCGTGLRHTFIDLGMSPPCESFVPREQIDSMEPYYPLHAFVCDQCLLVQLKEYVSPQ